MSVSDTANLAPRYPPSGINAAVVAQHQQLLADNNQTISDLHKRVNSLSDELSKLKAESQEKDSVIKQVYEEGESPGSIRRLAGLFRLGNTTVRAPQLPLMTLRGAIILVAFFSKQEL